MSEEKVEQLSTTLEVEGQFQLHLLPFTLPTEEAYDPTGTLTDFHGLSDQSLQHQQPSDLFSSQANKCISISLKEGKSSHDNQHEWTTRLTSKLRVARKTTTEKHLRAVNRPRRRMQGRPPVNREIITAIRACSACNTTRTPLWRSGPQGPKSLCNACGIRQMKARRKANAYNLDRTIPYKKRYKFANLQKDLLLKLRFDKTISAGSRSDYPQDEEYAAILLMALSCS